MKKQFLLLEMNKECGFSMNLLKYTYQNPVMVKENQY